jgi:hypothetical protein
MPSCFVAKHQRNLLRGIKICCGALASGYLCRLLTDDLLRCALGTQARMVRSTNLFERDRPFRLCFMVAYSMSVLREALDDADHPWDHTRLAIKRTQRQLDA